MSTHTVVTRITGAFATLTAVLALAGWGISTRSTYGIPAAIGNSALVTQAHNQADITFVQNMIPHQVQTVEMSKLAPDHASDAQVKSVASTIQAAQQAELDQMNGFLQVWNTPPPLSAEAPAGAPNPDDMGLTDHDTMPPMMAPETVTQLSSVTGPTFDKMFLRTMTAHHMGAIAMATTELRNGQNPDAKVLAQRIIDVRRSEIIEMRAMGRRIDHGGGW
jgi:uncharacterized protein (DUF305 family)